MQVIFNILLVLMVFMPVSGFSQGRQIQYTPKDGGFCCVNGNNRYTRALYGPHSEYRIETSDKPIFALYKNKNYRNVRFVLEGVQLDSAEYCEAMYVEGRRDYLLKDSRWGESATLTIQCVPNFKKDGGFWKFDAEGFESNPSLSVILCPIVNPKLSRNGDLGVDKAGSFEPNGTIDKEYEISIDHTLLLETYPETNSHNIQIVSSPSVDFDISKSYFQSRSSVISFSTPDPYLNTLGSTLTLAADGVWDGTWLHGAVGWRMPLPGWRAGYLGDVLGMNERAISHFDAYAASQVSNVPPIIESPSQDPKQSFARAEKKWGTQMYSNGYICRNPNRNDQMHHYDMNLAYIDELLWHFQFDADTTYMRKMWQVITSHLAWEKRNFDKDNNHLYDAYCCIWASDALYYNGGDVTHSSAYNYRGNLLAAKIANLIGEDPTPYQQEADDILKAMNRELWIDGHWAEYKDIMGLKRVHPNCAVWSIYTPVDCGVCTAEQMYSCIDYVDRNIPHIPIEIVGQSASDYVISTSDWMPYSWSINNVASAEIMHTALACFEAGRSDIGMHLVRGNILDQMYLGASPGNIGQMSYYDPARGECYRDFGDNIGISSRAIIQGVFGIIPQALDGQCIIRPGFPLEWDSVEVKTPYLSYLYNKVGNKGRLTITQNFTRSLQLVVKINGENGHTIDYVGTDALSQTIEFDIPSVKMPQSAQTALRQQSDRKRSSVLYKGSSVSHTNNGDLPYSKPIYVNIPFNANVTDIFRNQYLSPRPQSTSLELPVQGIGEWCHPQMMVDINDSVFRSLAVNDQFSVEGVKFRTPQRGKNIAFVSLWDNYPDSIELPLYKKVKGYNKAALLLTGSTNHMQVNIDNALIIAEYTDGSSDTLALCPPDNYCPIEQDYYVDSHSFRLAAERPIRISFSTGIVSRNLGDAMGIPKAEVYGRELKGGAAQMLIMPINPRKSLRCFRLRCLSNDIIVGIMAITLLK